MTETAEDKDDKASLRSSRSQEKLSTENVSESHPEHVQEKPSSHAEEQVPVVDRVENSGSNSLLASPLHLNIPIIDPSELGHGPDSPTTSLIQSLREQLSLSHDQSQQLNTKLVASISRHADLEDQHVSLQHQYKELQERSETLENEKQRWEESMNTGLLVERSQIRDEMQKLAAGLVEEERRRGSAEERRIKVENEVDDLAASLFDQANTMVAAERIHRTQAETRLKETEENLAAAESAIRDMQLHLQSLPSSANPQIQSPAQTTSISTSRRLLASHLPYSEFNIFLSHLRALRPLRETSKTMFPPPIITNLVAQPFIARTMTEDQDPTLRLDAAPNLSYFSRRTVANAAMAGDLVIEPVQVGTLLTGTTSIHDLSCSMCGTQVFAASTPGQPQSPSGSHFGQPPPHPTHRSSSRFSLKPFFASPSPSTSTVDSVTESSAVPGTSMTVHVFRIAKTAPISTGTSSTSDEKAKIYPLCKNGWCLERLRATCELWHFVRTGIIHAVWHGDDGYTAPDRPVIFERVSNPGLDAPDQAVERKKSSWALGFKLSEKSSWRGPFRSSESVPTSPGLSPQEENRADGDKSGVETKADGEDKEEATNGPENEAAPEALLEDERPKLETVSSDLMLPSITEQQPSPITEGRDEAETKKPEMEQSNENADTTPQEESGQASPSPDEKVPPTETSENNAEASESVEPKSSEPDRSVSPRPKGPRVPPRRSMDKRRSIGGASTATLSPRASIDISTEIGSKGLPAESGASEPEKTSTDDKKEESTDNIPSMVDLSEPNEASPVPGLPPKPPRLPTRRPQRDSTSDVLGTHVKWMDPESSAWEVKTWKMVVKLKEDMWKARIGVEQL